MKKFFVVTILIGLIFTSSVLALSPRSEVEFDDMSTKNFEEKMKGINYAEIKSLCSYDFCEYVRGTSYKNILENFINSYLKTLSNDDDRAGVRVKGLKITKVIFQN